MNRLYSRIAQAKCQCIDAEPAGFVPASSAFLFGRSHTPCGAGGFLPYLNLAKEPAHLERHADLALKTTWRDHVRTAES